MNVHWKRTGVPRTVSTQLAAIGVTATLDTLSTVMASLAMVYITMLYTFLTMLLVYVKITQISMNVLPIPQTPASRCAPTLLAPTLVDAMVDSG